MTTSAGITVPFHIGEPSHFVGLALIPLFPGNEPHLDYIGLDEALAHGLRITDVDDAVFVEFFARRMFRSPISTSIAGGSVQPKRRSSFSTVRL